MKKQHPFIKSIHSVLLAKGFEGAYILQVTQHDQCISVQLQIPPHKELSNLIELLPNIQQELKAHDYKITETLGKRITILFGLNNLTNIKFRKEYLHHNTLKIELPSAFGSCYLDFSDGASCHLLNGGTTRMGKTSLLLYLSTVLYIQTNAHLELHITSTKLKDFYPFNHLPNVSLSRTETELITTLDYLIHEYEQRDALLYSPSFEKATDAKSVKELYPEKYHLFKPIFLIIDEYARFSDNKDIQKKLMEIVESAGYVNIHIIISTQRPDARSVLHPRIKANLLARICFTTADANNSIVILDKEGAELLGKIEGRAIFLDSDTNIIQVPYLSTTKCEELLNPYKKEVNNHEPNPNQNKTRPTNHELTNKIQNLFTESNSQDHVHGKLERNQRVQSGHETPINGWERLASSENKR